MAGLVNEQQIRSDSQRSIFAPIVSSVRKYVYSSFVVDILVIHVNTNVTVLIVEVKQLPGVGFCVTYSV